MGGASEEVAVDLAVTSDGAALYLLGTYLGDADFGGVTLTSQGGKDTFVVQLAPATGAFLVDRIARRSGIRWGRHRGIRQGRDCAATAADDVFIASSLASRRTWTRARTPRLVTSGGSSTDGYVLQLTNQGDYHRAWHLGNVANSATEADQIYLQDGNLYVAGLFLGQTQLPQGTLTGDASRVNAFLFKLVPEASIPTDTPPGAHNDEYTLWKNYTLTVPTCEGVLDNDSNPNLDSLQATLGNDGPRHGTVSLNLDGSFTYTPDRDDTGSDHFTYTVDNGRGGSDSATVDILVQGLEAVTFTSTDVPKNILDASTIVTRSSIVVNTAFQVDDLDVKLNITHPRTLDLNAFLVGPDGTRVELFTDVGGTKSANFTNTIFDDEATKLITKGTAPFTGSYKPEGMLSAFDRNRWRNLDLGAHRRSAQADWHAQ